MATTLKFLILGDDQASSSFDRFSRSVAGASVAADRNSAALKGQSRTADVTAQATLALSRTDLILEDAQKVLAGRLDETSFALKEQGKQADETAVKVRAAGDAAGGAGGGFGALATPMGAAIAAGVALSPVIATVGLGLGGLALAALSASKDTAAMGAAIAPLKTEFTGFSAALKPEVLTLVGQGARVAAQFLGELEPVAAATGTALGTVLDSVGVTFRSGEWQQFFGFMQQTAGPDAVQLGKVLTDLLVLLPPLLEDLQHDAQGLLGVSDAALKAVNGLNQLEGKVSTLGGKAATSSGPLATFWTALKQAVSAETPTGQLAAVAALLGVTGDNAKATTAHLHDVKLAFAGAAPPVVTLATDLATLATTTSENTVALQAFSDLWDQFVGKSVSDQQAILNTKQAFETFTAAVKTSGRTSTAAQLAFLSIFDTLQSGVSTLQANGAGVSALNGFYEANIAKLEKLHGLTPAQRADIQGLVKDYDAWANSVTGLSGNTVNAADVLRSDFLATLATTHRLVPQASADTTAFADAILKTGDKSQATAADRQALIRDLEKSGVSAQQAAQLVTALQQQIDHLHGTSVNVGVTATGHGQVDISGTGINTHTLNVATGQISAGGGHTAAAGWMVTGGTPGVDSVPILAQQGELVVSKPLVDSGAVDHLRGRIPGFAAGGIVQPAAITQLGGYEAAFAQVAAQAFAQQAVRDAIKKFTVPPGFGNLGHGPLSASAAAAQAFAQSLLPYYGWASQWPALDALWQRESGWNSYAVNPGSGAYGIPQALPAAWGHPYALGDYKAQDAWGLDYIRGRYGSPDAAWAHELAAGWYGDGLDAVIGTPTLIGVGERGRERVQVTPLGSGGGSGGGSDTYVTNNNVTVNAPPGTHPAQLGKQIVEYLAEYERVNGKGWRS